MIKSFEEIKKIVEKFPDGETMVKINDNVRGELPTT